MIKELLLVGLGGAAGSMARYGMKVAAAGLAVSPLIATFAVNVLGSLLIGLSLSLLEQKWLVLVIVVGFLGGFTTFSTFSAETVSLLREGETLRGLLYALSTFIVCLLFAFIGFKTGNAIC